MVTLLRHSRSKSLPGGRSGSIFGIPKVATRLEICAMVDRYAIHEEVYTVSVS